MVDQNIDRMPESVFDNSGYTEQVCPQTLQISQKMLANGGLTWT
jgi:hypothetical protein